MRRSGQDVLVETSPRSIWETRATEIPILRATCSWGIPRRLRISASRQSRASFNIAVTDASKASFPLPGLVARDEQDHRPP